MSAPREVPCRGCGTPLMRQTHYRVGAICKKCSNKICNRQNQERIKKNRLEARRYRILMAVSPYGSFDELLDALRVRNTHTREHHRDLTNERRAS